MILCCVVIPSSWVVNQLLSPKREIWKLFGKTKQNQKKYKQHLPCHKCLRLAMVPFLVYVAAPSSLVVAGWHGQAGKKWRGPW